MTIGIFRRVPCFFFVLFRPSASQTTKKAGATADSAEKSAKSYGITANEENSSEEDNDYEEVEAASEDSSEDSVEDIEKEDLEVELNNIEEAEQEEELNNMKEQEEEEYWKFIQITEQHRRELHKARQKADRPGTGTVCTGTEGLT
jgi:hypothetical protein